MGVPAGWYDDGQGVLRYWDGQAWTEHTQPLVRQAAPEPATEPGTKPAPEPATESGTKPAPDPHDPVTGLAATRPLPVGGFGAQPTERLPVQSDLQGWSAPGVGAQDTPHAAVAPASVSSATVPPSTVAPAAVPPTTTFASTPTPAPRAGGPARGLLIVGLTLLGIGLVALIAGAFLLLSGGSAAPSSAGVQTSDAAEAEAASDDAVDDAAADDAADDQADAAATAPTTEAAAADDAASDPDPSDDETADTATEEDPDLGLDLTAAEDVAQRFSYAWGTGDCATEYALASDTWRWGDSEDEYCEGNIGDTGLTESTVTGSRMVGDTAVVTVDETLDFGDGITTTDAWEYTLILTDDGWRVDGFTFVE